ncbi:MAG: helix-turn-helix domain-containing protein [Rhodoferax sp.]|uniref:Crp/Fnr family transcriptional regulator n=1 Tax=Rhodoferax sp. TaxID=50421 RepID=UPI002ACE5010|nr:helix-turn-helix domain-containing protein [Rhodoferax sp.]MDZ7890286.1 helix-turn-helix domain-containing protein [Rhodoferax sp.]
METRLQTSGDELAALELGVGAALTVCQMQNIWRLDSGAMRVGNLRVDGEVELVCMALPGDLVGVEYWAGEQIALHASAVLPTRLVPVDMGRMSLELVLREALLTARRRSMEIVAVRSGPVAERVRSLLLLLADAISNLPDKALPSIKETAELVGSSPETVSRVLSHLKQLQLLVDRRRGRGALDMDLLRDARFGEGMTSSAVRLQPHAMQSI